MNYLFFIILLTASTISAQTCRTESEIQSTTPDKQFIDYGDGTILDKTTGLIWQKCQLGLSGNQCDIGNVSYNTWQQALNKAELNNLAGYSDWRLPNIKELRSILELRCFNPSINTNIFPNTSGFRFWSSSPDIDINSEGLFSHSVDFYNGSRGGIDKSATLAVRLVRTN